MKKNLFVFATIEEALPTIKKVHAQLLSPNLYQFKKGYLLITNMGILAANHAITKVLMQFPISHVINLGLTASLEEGAKIGEIHRVSSVEKHTLLPEKIDKGSKELSKNLYPPLLLGKEGKRLLTTDYPIHNEEIKQRLQKKFDLVDMEGYGVALAAKEMDVKVTLYKIVSDFAAKGGRELIRQHINELAEQLAELAYESVEST